MRRGLVVALVALVSCGGAEAEGPMDGDATVIESEGADEVSDATSPDTTVAVEDGDGADGDVAADGLWAPGEVRTPERSPMSDNDIGEALLRAPTSRGAFWTPPEELPGLPGDIIWIRKSGTIGSAVTYLVMYHSLDALGRPAPATGWLALPPDIDENTPIVSWGHGTVGIADQCAPSQSLPLSNQPIVTQYLEDGYIVVAPDYIGLGVDGRHAYRNGESMAYPMIDGAIAAQRFTGSRGPVVFSGYSIGGRGSVFSNSLAPVYAPQLDVLGVVGMRPAIEGEYAMIFSDARDGEYRGWLVLGLLGEYAATEGTLFDIEDWLTPYGIEFGGEIADNECASDVLVTFADANSDELFVRQAEDAITYDPWIMTDDLGPAPTLLMLGLDDILIYEDRVLAFMEAVCAQDYPVKRVNFEAGHEVNSDYEYPFVKAWLDARLAGEDPPSSCGEPIVAEAGPDPVICFKPAPNAWGDCGSSLTPDGEWADEDVVNPLAVADELDWELVGTADEAVRHSTGATVTGFRTEVWEADIDVARDDFIDWFREYHMTDLRKWSVAVDPPQGCGLIMYALTSDTNAMIGYYESGGRTWVRVITSAFDPAITWTDDMRRLFFTC